MTGPSIPAAGATWSPKLPDNITQRTTLRRR
jgi:hypothetical protein